MKFQNQTRSELQRFFLITAFWLTTGVGFAETNLVRIALTPFSAQAGNPKLEQVATTLPDLLTASLSHDSRFELVERDKVNAIWSEMHLAEAGLTSADTVAKVGKVLSCDWLVSGSLIQTETGPQIWVKVIDTQSSVVLDLQSLPFNSANLSATSAAIAQFLAQARSRAHPREFIALDRFEDRSAASVTLEDWTPRLTALIEKHFLTAGYGVVERESVAPIFSEYQLQSAGATADASKRVKLKPAFWVVGGSWKWLVGQQNKIIVSIDIKKMGGGEQLLSIAKQPDAELEKAVVDAIQDALITSGSVTDEQALAAEEKFRSEHIGQLVQSREGARLPSRFNTNTTSIILTNPHTGEARQMTVDPQFHAQKEGHKEDMLKSLKQAILLNPKDMNSKFMLGMALFGVADPVESRHGEDLLKEVAASGDAMFATKAKNWLDDVHTGKISFQRDRNGMLNLGAKGQLASFPQPPLTAPAKMVPNQAGSIAPQKTSWGGSTTAERLQNLFSDFTPVSLQKDANGYAVMHRFHVQDNVLPLEGGHCFGFRFTVPAWADGNLKMFNLLAKTEAQKDFKTGLFKFGIVGQTGPDISFTRVTPHNLGEFPALQKKFPFTHTIFTEELDRSKLEPEKSYAIWFWYEDDDLPDIAVSVTIDSPRGENECGRLPEPPPVR